MSIDLPQGANVTLSTPRVRVEISWDPEALSGAEMDVSAFLLTEAGRVRSDGDMIFYNQPQAEAGAIRLTPGSPTLFQMELDRLPEELHKVAVTATLHEGERRGQSFALFRTLSLRIADLMGEELARFRLPTAGLREVALIVGEFYRRQGQWKFRAVGQGFVGGLGPLATSFGVEVEAEAETSAAPPPAFAPPSSCVVPERALLERAGEEARLTRIPPQGEIRLLLHWNRTPVRRGLSSLFSAPKVTDLEIGCFVEIEPGERALVQARGGYAGSLTTAPFVRWFGESAEAGRELRISCEHWPRIRVALLFVHLASPGDWDGVMPGGVTVRAPGQPEVAAPLFRGQEMLCGLLDLRRVGEEGMRITRLGEFFRDQEALDQRYGWGFRWR